MILVGPESLHNGAPYATIRFTLKGKGGLMEVKAIDQSHRDIIETRSDPAEPVVLDQSQSPGLIEQAPYPTRLRVTVVLALLSWLLVIAAILLIAR